MTKLICDYCETESDSLTTINLDGFRGNELCSLCLEKFIKVEQRWAEKSEKARLGFISKNLGIPPFIALDNVKEHEHLWSTGWISLLNSSRELHQLCTFTGCKEEKVSRI